MFDDWTFAGDRRRLQASIGPVITSLLPDTGKTTRITKLEDDGVQLILQTLTNHATCHVILQVLLADRIEACFGLKGTVCTVQLASCCHTHFSAADEMVAAAGAGIQQAFKVHEVACQDQPKLLIATCSELALHPDRNRSLDVRMEALQGEPTKPHT